MEDVDGLNNPMLDMSTSMLANYSMGALIGGLIFGIIGIWLFRQGRKTNQLWWVWTGLVLMIYPLLITGTFGTWAVGIGLCALAYYKRR